MKFFRLFIKKLLRYLLKPLSFVPALCMMYLIYTFSGQPAEVSSILSESVTEKILRLFFRILQYDVSQAQFLYYLELFHGLIRKCAHILEYFSLAIFITLPLYVYKLRGFKLVLFSALFCILFASLDEYHQTFVPGRSGSPRDVLIDSIGIFPGIYITRIFGWLGRMTIFKPLTLDHPAAK